MPANFTFCLILQIVSPDEVTKTGLAYLHTAHCLGSGEIMISAMGTPDGKEQGILVLDLFNNKDGQSHNSKKIMNAEKQKVPREVRPRLRLSLPFFLRDSRASETRARVKINPREKRRHAACRLFSRGVIFTRARVSFALLSLRKNGGLLVV